MARNSTGDNPQRALGLQNGHSLLVQVPGAQTQRHTLNSKEVFSPEFVLGSTMVKCMSPAHDVHATGPVLSGCSVLQVPWDLDQDYWGGLGRLASGLGRVRIMVWVLVSQV